MNEGPRAGRRRPGGPDGREAIDATAGPEAAQLRSDRRLRPDATDGGRAPSRGPARTRSRSRGDCATRGRSSRSPSRSSSWSCLPCRCLDFHARRARRLDPRGEPAAAAGGLRSSSTWGSRCAAIAGRSCCAASASGPRPRLDRDHLRQLARQQRGARQARRHLPRLAAQDQLRGLAQSPTFGTIFIERDLRPLRHRHPRPRRRLLVFPRRPAAAIQIIMGIGVAVVVVLAVALLHAAQLRPPDPRPAAAAASVVELYDRFEEGVFRDRPAPAPGARDPHRCSSGRPRRCGCSSSSRRSASDISLGISGAFFVALVASLLTAVPFTPGRPRNRGGRHRRPADAASTACRSTEATTIALVDRAISVLSIIVFGLIAYVRLAAPPGPRTAPRRAPRRPLPDARRLRARGHGLQVFEPRKGTARVVGHSHGSAHGSAQPVITV